MFDYSTSTNASRELHIQDYYPVYRYLRRHFDESASTNASMGRFCIPNQINQLRLYRLYVNNGYITSSQKNDSHKTKRMQWSICNELTIWEVRLNSGCCYPKYDQLLNADTKLYISSTILICIHSFRYIWVCISIRFLRLRSRLSMSNGFS